jgi:hypothetical protein
MSRIAYCTARNQDQANRIVEHLRNEGFTNHDISVLMYQNGEIKHVNGEGHETHAAEGTAAGVGTGAVLGGALGWLTGIGNCESRRRSIDCGRTYCRCTEWDRDRRNCWRSFGWIDRFRNSER